MEFLYYCKFCKEQVKVFYNLPEITIISSKNCLTSKFLKYIRKDKNWLTSKKLWRNGIKKIWKNHKNFKKIV